MKLTLKGLLPLFVFLGLGIAFAIGLTKDPSVLPSQMIDRPFPEFQLPDLFDETHMLDKNDFKGEVVLVNVFGSWCVACDQEHPLLMKLARDKEVVIIGVDWKDTREKGQRWLERRGNPYVQTIFDADSKLIIDLGVTGAPESFIVDKTGQIRYKYVGPITPDVWTKDLKPLVQSLEASP